MAAAQAAAAAAPSQPQPAPSDAPRSVYLWYPPLPLRAEDDGLATLTSREQAEVERRVDEALKHVLPRTVRTNSGKGKSKAASFFGGDDEDDDGVADVEADTGPPLLSSCPSLCELSMDLHSLYLQNGLRGSGCHSSLDASRPWLVYWCVHGLDVLDRLQSDLSDESARAIVAFLARCVHPNGGFGGGPGQQAHSAPTYAAVLSLAILTSHPACAEAALGVLRTARQGVYDFLLRCKVASGSGGAIGGFRVSRDGEVDTRGAYTVLAVASLLQLQSAELTAGVLDWIAACQTYEGGLGGEPGNEAHGGYTFCGLAAAALLGGPHRLNLPLLSKWAANRQMTREGGFQGRTNKLVDGCYSFWVGALFPMLDRLQNVREHMQPDELHRLFDDTQATTPSTADDAAATAGGSSSSDADSLDGALESSLFDSLALQRYILVACQGPMGGLRDKPGKHPDLYHTCYCLSGLSVAQHADQQQASRTPLLGRQDNLVAPVHPLYNIRHAHVERIRRVFQQDKKQ